MENKNYNKNSFKFILFPKGLEEDGCILSCVVQLILELVRLQTKLSDPEFNLLTAAVSPIVHCSMDQVICFLSLMNYYKNLLCILNLKNLLLYVLYIHFSQTSFRKLVKKINIYRKGNQHFHAKLP